MIEVTLETLQMSLVSHHRVAVLKEIEVARYLPILIGPCEADAIANSLNNVPIPRPQTHDLIVNLFQALDANLLYIYISELSDNIYFGRLVLQAGGREIEVDTRPSDAIAIAVRVGAPIFVAEEVMDEAAVLPEQDLTSAGRAERELGVFRDFLNTLDEDATS